MMQYTVLFQIECLHGYFAGNPCRSLTLVPTDDCRQLLGRYQMLFRPAPGGGVVYGPKQSPPDVLKSFDETAAFTFALISTDPALNYYTDLDSGQSAPLENIYYFDNSTNYTGNAFGRSRQLLHPPGIPFAKSPVFVRPKMSSFVPATAQTGECKIIEPISEQVLWQSPLPQKDAPLKLDLRKLPEGIYNLSINDKALQKFYLSDDLALRRWGVISIYAGGVRQAGHIPDNCQAIDSQGVIHPRTFTVALESRKTIWRYYIIDSADKQDFSRYELVASSKAAAGQVPALESDIPFVRLAEPEPVDGHAAWVFESKAPLPLLLSPASALSLILRPNGTGPRGGKAIRLPYAQPNTLVAKNGPGPRQMCSDIFVYV